MLATIVATIMIVAALGLGAWVTLGGAVIAATASGMDDDANRAFTIRVGVALVLIGLVAFMAGAIGAARVLAA